MRNARSPNGSSLMPMLRRLIRRWVDFEFDLAGLAVDEHDVLNDLNVGRG